MSDKKHGDSRRKLLKSIAAGSGAVVAGKSLPESWSKPIVDSVMLPAHAATTDDGTAPTECPVCSGVYCADIAAHGSLIEITLDGNDVSVYINSIAYSGTGTGVTTCDGSSFSVSVDHVGGLVPHVSHITGLIADDCSEVTGTYTVDDLPEAAYTATPCV